MGNLLEGIRFATTLEIAQEATFQNVTVMGMSGDPLNGPIMSADFHLNGPIRETCEHVFNTLENAASGHITGPFEYAHMWVSKNPFFDTKDKACLDIAERCYLNNVKLMRDSPLLHVTTADSEYMFMWKACSVYREHDVQKVMEEIIWEPVLISHAVYVELLNENILAAK